MRHIRKVIKTVLKKAFTFVKRMRISSSKSFSEESYRLMMPLFANINSYLQTFLGVFSSSLMALNAALITVILSKEMTIQSIYFISGISLFIASISLYLASFFILFMLRINLIKKSKEEKYRI